VQKFFEIDNYKSIVTDDLKVVGTESK